MRHSSREQNQQQASLGKKKKTFISNSALTPPSVICLTPVFHWPSSSSTIIIKSDATLTKWNSQGW